MTSFFRIAFTWRHGHFIPRLYEGTFHVHNIKCYLKSQTVRMRYPFQSTGRPISHRNEWSFRVYNTVAKIGYRSEVLPHFLARLRACNLILHIHVVINWQLSIQGIRWPVSNDRIADHRGYVFFEVSRWQVTCHSPWLNIYINPYNFALFFGIFQCISFLKFWVWTTCIKMP